MSDLFIPYSVARGRFIERLGATDAEILLWCRQERLTLYGRSASGYQTNANAGAHLLEEFSPAGFTKAETKLRECYFSRAQVDEFDPAADPTCTSNNPSGRRFTLQQAAGFLGKSLDPGEVTKEIALALRLGRWDTPEVSPERWVLAGLAAEPTTSAADAEQYRQWLEVLGARLVIPEREILHFRCERFGIPFERGDEISQALGGRVEGEKQTRPSSRDRETFQQSCSKHWRDSPHTTIRGDAGIVWQVGGSFLGQYCEATLIRWASEVAPAHVKKPGRKPKELKE